MEWTDLVHGNFCMSEKICVHVSERTQNRSRSDIYAARISLKTFSKVILNACSYDMVGRFRFLSPQKNELIIEGIHQK